MIRTILATTISALVLSAQAQILPVNLVQNADFYFPRDEITVFVTNQRPDSIVTYDHQSYCSIVMLQYHKTNGEWMDYAPCTMGIPSRPFWMKPGQEVKVVLSDEQPRPVGEYRARFYYYANMQNSIPSGPMYVVYTPTFRVVPY